MRATLHLVTAEDYLLLRPALQPALARALRGFFSQEARRLDLDRLVAAARTYTAEQPRTFPELRAFLSAIAPNETAQSLSYAVRTHLPLVQVPPAGTWGCFRIPRYVSAEAWLQRPLASAGEGLRHLIARYLAAFGPATRRDIEAWSGLSRLQTTIDELSPTLCSFQDERGRVLLDLPGLPLPRPEVPAPARFLPEFDNLVLAHADRTRVLPEEYRSAVLRPPGRVLATFLVDGIVRGTWRIERARNTAVLVIEPFEPLPEHARDALVAEGERLVRFVEDNATTFATRLVGAA
jgi:hypothetical protein